MTERPAATLTFDSGLTDQIETARLAMSAELLGHAVDMLGDRAVTAPQLRFLAECLTEVLRDVHRIAESRGARLVSLACGEAQSAGESAPDL